MKIIKGTTVITLCFQTLKNNYFSENQGVSKNKGCPKNIFLDPKNNYFGEK